MKQQQAPKWLLTTALLAVLGANYGFQTSSLSLHKDNGLFELSSETSSGDRSSRSKSSDSKAEAAPAPSTPPTEVKVEAKKEELKPVVAEKPEPKKSILIRHEGKVIAEGACTDGSCKSAVLDVDKIESILKTISIDTKTASTLTASAKAEEEVEESEYDCDFTEEGKKETRTQKRDRLRCEKVEKERTKREERLAKFEDKMEDIKDRCEVSTSESKLQCMISQFNSAASRFSGRNGVPADTVQRYYKSMVVAELNKELYNSDKSPEEMMSTLQDMVDGLPSEFSGLRKSVLDAIQNQTRTRAASIQQQYRLADTYKNNPQAYLQTIGEAEQQQAELMQMADVYSAGARTSDAFSSDVSFAKYYQASYIPAMRKMFATINTTTNVDGSVTNTVESTTRTRTRGSSDISTDLSPSTITRGSSFKTETDLQPWTFLNDGSGVRVGTPSSNSRGGTRGSRQMGN